MGRGLKMAEHKSREEQGIFKAATVLMFTTLISGVLGFVREQILMSKFGLSYITDAYFAAFSIPDFLYNLLVGGTIGAAFIPVFRSYLSTKSEEEAWRIASTAINVVIIGFTIGITVGMIFTPQLVSLVAYKFSGKTLDLTVTLTRIMLPAVMVTGFNGIMLGILQSHRYFLPPALGAIFYNIAIITVGVLLEPYLGIAAFSTGVVVGIIGNFLIQIFSLRKIGIKYRPIIDLKHPGVKKLGILLIPAIIGLSANQINLIVNQNLASSLAEGSIAALRLANRLMILPLAIFAMSISTAVFPTLTDKAAKSEFESYKETLSLGIRSMSFLTIPSGIAFMVLGVPIIRLLFQQREFTPEDTVLTASVLFFYSFTLFAQGISGILTRGFYAMQKSFIPVTISAITIFINYLSNILLKDVMGVRGLALAFSLTAIFNMIFLVYVLRRQIGSLGITRIVKSLSKVVVASLIMATVAYGVSLSLEKSLDLSLKSHQLLQVLLTFIVAGLVYGLLAWLFRMEEVHRVIAMVGKKFNRKARI